MSYIYKGKTEGHQTAEKDAETLNERILTRLTNCFQTWGKDDVHDLKEFLESLGDPIIFGGAVRDAIANDEINDIDILCAPQTRQNLVESLTERGYKIVPKEGSEIPADGFVSLRMEKPGARGKTSKVDVISLPRHMSEKILQGGDLEMMKKAYKLAMAEMIGNVDIVACAVGYSAGGGLLEFLPNAVSQAKAKVIEVRKDNLMHHPDRAKERIEKLTSRGWTLKPKPPTRKIEPDVDMGF
jgi:hypothetical protein